MAPNRRKFQHLDGLRRESVKVIKEDPQGSNRSFSRVFEQLRTVVSLRSTSTKSAMHAQTVIGCCRWPILPRALLHTLKTGGGAAVHPKQRQVRAWEDGYVPTSSLRTSSLSETRSDHYERRRRHTYLRLCCLPCVRAPVDTLARRDGVCKKETTLRLTMMLAITERININSTLHADARGAKQ